MNSTNNTRQAAWITLGSFFSFSFAIISSMILSRYFEKADYGTYKQVIYVYNTLLVVFTLGLPRAYSFFLPRVPHEEAKSVINKINTLFFFLGGFSSFMLFLFSGVIADFLKNEDLDLAIKYFSPVPLLMLPTMGLEAILATYKKTQLLTLYNVVSRTASLACVCIPVIFWNGGYIDAIIGFTIASFISFIIALYIKYLPVKQYKKNPTFISYKNIFEFALPLFYASLWGVIIKSVDQFFISRYYGNEVFAEFSNGAIELPFIAMIIGACSTVLSPIFSKLKHQDADVKNVFYPIWMNVFNKSAMLIYPILIFCLFFSDIMMTVLYGQKYESSFIYFCIINVANFFTIISYAPLIINIGKVKYYSNVHFISAIVLVLLEYIAVMVGLSVYFIVIISTICHLGRIFALLYMVAKFFNLGILELFPSKTILKIVIPSIIILILTRQLLSIMEISSVSNLVVGGSIYCLLFLLIAKFLNLNYISIIKPLVNK